MDKDTLNEAIVEFDLAEDQWRETRQQALEDIKFCRLGEQWDESVKEKRKREARPCLTENKLPAFARQVVNDARQNKPSIKVHPADDRADPETAEIMNGLIRNIEYTSDAEVAYDTALECAVYGGLGFFRIDVDHANYDQFDLDIQISRIANPLSVYPDPNTVECDASDWRRAFITEMMPRDQFRERYPDADPVDFKGDYDENWRTKEDVRIAERWMSDEEDAELVRLNDGTTMLGEDYLNKKDLFDSAGLIVVNQRPTKVNRVKQQIITCADVLDEIEWAGRFIPIIPVYGEEFSVEGKRYFKSMFYDAKDTQRRFNYWRTATTEQVALSSKAPWVGAKGQFASDAQNWATASQENHPYLEYDVVEGAMPPQQQPFAQIPAGALQEAVSADADMKAILGMHDPALGKSQPYDMSGKAVHEWKVQSDNSNYHFVDNLSRGMRYAGRVLLDLIPHIYNSERVLRVMGYDESVENVPIMQPYKKGGAVKIHDFSKGKYDLTVEVGASYGTKRQESLDAMMSMVSSAPELMQVIGDLIAKNMDWDGADDIAKRLKALLPPQLVVLDNLDGLPDEAKGLIANMQNQLQQMQQTLQQKDVVLAEMDQAIKLRDQALNDKQGELQLKDKKIETDVMIANIKEEGDRKLETLKAEYDEQLTILKSQLEQAKQPAVLY